MKALLLLSGGIDSPVAGKMMIDRGVEVIAVHFDNQPFTTPDSLNKSKKIAKMLGIKRFYVVKHGFENQKYFLSCKANRRYGCQYCRRMMFRVAERIAELEKCDFLVTGENLGQVASQTLSNMYVEDAAIKKMIIRPLLCKNKEETIELAKKFGTYDISTEPGMCCNLVPKNPATKSKLEDVEREEKKVDINELVENSIKSMEIIEV